MKRLMIYLFIVLMALPCLAAIDPSVDNKNTWENAYRFTGKPKDLFLDWCVAMEDAVDGTTGVTSLYYIPTATASAPTAVEGTVFYDSTTDTIKYRNASTWVSLTGLAAGAAGTLDDSYNSGFAIDVDGTAVTLTVSDGDNNAALIVNANDATNNANGIEVVVAASNTGAGVYVNGTAGTVDFLADNFSVANTGLVTCVGIDTTGTIIMANDEVISNATNDTILFTTGDEDLKLDFTTGADLITLSSSTGVTTIDMASLTSIVNVNNLTGTADDMTIKMTADGGGEDLIINQAGAVDASVQILSAGTGADAIDIETSAGGIYLESAGASKDIKVDATAGSVYIDGGEAAADAIVVDASNAAGGIDMDCGSGGFDLTATAGDIVLQNTTAKDIVLDASAGRVLITGTESAADAIALIADGANGEISINAAVGGVDIDGVLGAVTINTTKDAGNAIHIEENGGTSGGINIYANQGTGVSATTEHDASIQLQSDDGGIGIYSTANLGDTVRIETNGGADENIIIQSLQGTGADSISLISDAGGIAITSTLGGIVSTSTTAKVFDGAAAETWTIEGTADEHEATLVFTDPTADITWTFPTGATDTLAVMGSTLATNVPEVVNSVTGGTNQLIFEGTANAFETIVTANDATADATISLPNDSGDVVYAPAGVVDYAAGTGALPITHTIITYQSQAGAEALTLADGQPGQILQVNHDEDGGNGVITPATALGYTSVDLADDGDMVTFLFVDTQGWIIIGTAGNAAPPVVTP